MAVFRKGFVGNDVLGTGESVERPNQNRTALEDPSSITRGRLEYIGTSRWLALIRSACEAWLRFTVPFMENPRPWQFVPRVGYLMKPNAELRYTNKLDFWAISRTNSLGFLDREPPIAEWAQANCHIVVIGSSFVEALETSIANKLPVDLQNWASREPPEMNVISSACGIGGTGSVHQMGFYDEYIQHLHPKLLVLVFTPMDLIRSSPVLYSLATGHDPE